MIGTNPLSFAALSIAMLCSAATFAQSTTQIAAEIGITAESVVVADLYSHADAMLVRLHGATDLQEALALHKQNVNDAMDQVAAAGAESGDALVEAQMALAQARTGLDNARNDLFDLATDGLDEEAVSVLRNWRQVARRQVPAEFRVLVMEPNDWRRVERALRAEQRCLRRGESLDPDHAALLGDLRATLAVNQAAGRLGQYMDSAEAVFDSHDSDRARSQERGIRFMAVYCASRNESGHRSVWCGGDRNVTHFQRPDIIPKKGIEMRRT